MITRLFFWAQAYFAFSASRYRALLLLLGCCLLVAACTRNKSWDKTLGGGKKEVLKAVQPTRDGGILLAGYSNSAAGGDKSQPSRAGSDDFWVVKLDAAGNKVWDKTYGGEQGDYLEALVPAPDGGFLLGGYSLSGKSGDKSEGSKGDSDFWIVKIDAAGNKEWDKTFGGNKSEGVYALLPTRDGGYLLGGYSSSDKSGDKSEANRGSCEGPFCTNDFWVIKIDAAGNKVWDKTLGGAGSENLTALQHTSDGGFILAGQSESDLGGDKSQPGRGSYDYWVVKLDAAGNKVWDKAYGSAGPDELADLEPTPDGGYILGGSSASNRSGDKTGENRGPCQSPNFCSKDYWIVKIDAAGNKVWDRTLGGSESDQFAALQPTPDGGYLLGGSSFSDISGEKTSGRRGASFDYWIVKLDAAGNKVWDRSLGGQGFDELTALQAVGEGAYLLGGYSESDKDADKSEGNHGGCEPDKGCSSDFWVLKIAGDDVPQRLASTLP